MGNRLKLELELPLDVVYYILLGLPVKSLSRFRCVSKQWCSLISHPHFLKEHSCRSQQNPLLLIAGGRDDDDTLVRLTTFNNQGFFLREFTSFKFQPFSGCYRCLDIELIQSYLGLVCFRQFGDDSVRLCNPSMEEITVLPNLPKGYVRICVGFGFAASTEEYKVARFFVKRPFGEEGCCDVFTVGTNGRWREARTPPPYVPRYDAHLPFLHGALHLLPDEVLLAQHDHHYIAVFDLDTEEYRALPFPEICCRARSTVHDQLCELRGSLCLTLASTINERILEVWLLKDYLGGKWMKQYNIDLSSVSFVTVTLLAMMCESFILLDCLPPDDWSELRYYSLRHNCFANKIATNCTATFYVESFSCPK